jgi:hypothetical protein
MENAPQVPCNASVSHPHDQKLSAADKEARVSAFIMLLQMQLTDPDIAKFMCFSDEATCHVSGEVNKYNCVI